MIRRRLIQPFVELLRQGMSPHKIALTVALGVTLGVTPVLGSTSLLCTITAIALRLNLPAIQLVNGLAWPLQLALLVPFLRLGARIFSVKAPALSVSAILAMIHAGAWHAILTLWTATLHALVAWLLVGAAAALSIYLLTAPLLRRVWTREAPAS